MIWLLNHLHTAVVPDDDLGRISEEEEQQPPRSQTPPMPPDSDPHQPSPSPPRPIRQRAMAQLRPVSIPDIVSDMAGKDPLRKMAEFDTTCLMDSLSFMPSCMSILSHMVRV